MDIQVHKLTKELLDDWLFFFDHDGFTDNKEWCGCYCMCYHWNEQLNSQRAWDCSKDASEFNRKQAVEWIKQGRMQGYLAYAEGKVVGWCNANDKQAYDNVNFRFAEVPDGGKRVKSIVCFTIAPEYRGHGVATALLEHVCKDAKDDGFDLAEAYPFAHNENHAYHGPVSMYEKNGFSLCDKIEGCMVFRKIL